MKKRIILILGMVICVGIAIFAYIKFSKHINFKENQSIEINGQVDPNSLIDEIKGYKQEDVVCDLSKVDTSKLGTYPIEFTVSDKKYTVNITVTDTNKPIVKGKDLTVLSGTDILAEQFVESIKDDTKTTVHFKEEYDFSNTGEYTVVLCIKDEADNVTKITQKLNVVKDQTPPELSGLKTMTIVVGEKPDYKKGVSIKDDYDKSPTFTVDDSKVDINKAGEYKVIYNAKDQSGNTTTYDRKIVITEGMPVIGKPTGSVNIPANSSKIVYLTFDDGPSKNTPKVLEVLKKYNVKATFFVTRGSKNYQHCIKDAYNAGHTIALHTYTHNYKSVYSSVANYYKDLKEVSDLVYRLTGTRSKYIRFPGGSSNAVSKRYCKGIMGTLTKDVGNKGYRYYDWNVSSTDAESGHVSVSKILKSACTTKHKNAMILMHDASNKETTVEALPHIIEYYAKNGYCFKGIDDSTFTCHHGHLNN